MSDTAAVQTRNNTDAAANVATLGLRRHQRQNRSAPDTGRAWIGCPARKRARSSANSAQFAYRLPASFCKHFRQMVSRSFGTFGCN